MSLNILPLPGGGGGSATPTGPAGGALAGTYPNPTLATPISSSNPYLLVGSTRLVPAFPCVDPSLPAWAWVNQGIATLNTTNGVQTIATNQTGGALSVNLRTVAAPAAPYTITATVIMQATRAITPRVGVAFRESATGRIVTFGGRDATEMCVEYWNSPTSFNGTLRNIDVGSANQLWFLRLRNTGTNLIFEFSTNGVTFEAFSTTTLNAFFATGPDQVGFFVFNNATGGSVAAISVLSWSVT